MKKTSIASEILASLPPHVKRTAIMRLGWVEALRRETVRRPNARRRDVAADLIAAARKRGETAPSAKRLFAWESSFIREGFSGLAGWPGRRTKRMVLPRPREVEQLDLAGVAELLAALCGRLRAIAASRRV